MILPPTTFLRGGRGIDAPNFEAFEGVPVYPSLGSALARVREVHFLFLRGSRVRDPGGLYASERIMDFFGFELCTPKTMAPAEPKASIETRSESVGVAASLLGGSTVYGRSTGAVGFHRRGCVPRCVCTTCSGRKGDLEVSEGVLVGRTYGRR